jgi:allantoin racemase
VSNRILVINPNSNARVTSAIDDALDPLRTVGNSQITCITLHQGPLGVESQRDVDVAASLVCDAVVENEQSAEAFVIACYSDPGLRPSRQLTRKPVFGIAEAGLATAISYGGRVGVISILAEAVERHWAYAKSLDLHARIVADIPINLGVAELADENDVGPRMLDIARKLRDNRGADVIVLGCAGMARYRRTLEDSLGVPIIDPTQAAVASAITALALGYRRAAPTPDRK